MTHRRVAVLLAMALLLGTAACRDDSGSRAAATPTTASTGTGAAPSPMSGSPNARPVSEADVAGVDQVLRRLDSELDRLESEMAVTEGEVE